jgi:circadian clock protein KaiB
MTEPHPASDGTDADTGEQWDLVVYVTNASPKGQRAIENLKRACEEHLPGRYKIEIVDVIKVVGDLSDSDRLLLGLELRPSGS